MQRENKEEGEKENEIARVISVTFDVTLVLKMSSACIFREVCLAVLRNPLPPKS